MSFVRFGLTTLLGIAAVAAPASHALAQSESRPGGLRVTQTDWMYVPVVTRDGASCSVPGVLALRDAGAAVGDNIVAIWYENPGLPGMDWPSMAWTSSNPWDAIKWVKSEHAIDDQWDFLWPVPQEGAPAATVTVPGAYNQGLMVDDPLQMITADPQAPELVSFLTSLGYPAASVPVDPDGPCDKSVVLWGLAQTAAFDACEQPNEAVADAMYASLVPLTCAQVVPPPPPPIPMIPGTTTPQPGTPLNPGQGWQRDSTPGWFYPPISTATTCGYRATIIWLYTHVNWLGVTHIRYCRSVIEWSCPNPTGAACPATPSCSEPIGPHVPPGPPAPVPCGWKYY